MLLAIWLLVVVCLFVVGLCFVDSFAFVVDCVVFCCGGLLMNWGMPLTR